MKVLYAHSSSQKLKFQKYRCCQYQILVHRLSHNLLTEQLHQLMDNGKQRQKKQSKTMSGYLGNVYLIAGFF